jgi:hypothetical protein
MPETPLSTEQVLTLLAEAPPRLAQLTAGLPPKAWTRSATVTGAGRPLQRSVFFYAQWLATHERSHLKHIARFVRALQPPA